MLKNCLCLLFATSLYSQVVINEILMQPDSASAEPLASHQWVELKNKGTEAVDLSTFTLTNRQAKASPLALALPAVTLPANAFLVIHFTAGNNALDFVEGKGDFYIEPASPFWDANADEAALIDGDQIIDFVAWSKTTAKYVPGAAHDDALAAAIWPKSRSIRLDFVAHNRFELGR